MVIFVILVRFVIKTIWGIKMYIKDIEYWCEKYTESTSLLVCRIILSNEEDYFGDCEFDTNEAQELIFGDKYFNMCISTAKEEALRLVGKAQYSDYMKRLKSYKFLGYSA